MDERKELLDAKSEAVQSYEKKVEHPTQAAPCIAARIGALRDRTPAGYGGSESQINLLLQKVQDETANVQREVDNMKQLQTRLSNDPLLRLASYREQPLPRQVITTQERR